MYERIYIGPKDALARLEWLDRLNEFAPQPFRQLAKILREEGDYVGARDVSFEMERLRRKKVDITMLQRLWSGVLRWTIGFGYYPSWALRWLFGSMLLGLIFYWGGYSAGGMVPTDATAYCAFRQDHKSLPAHYEHFHASMYSLENSFPLVKLGQIDRWQPDPSPQRLKHTWNFPSCFSRWISLECSSLVPLGTDSLRLAFCHVRYRWRHWTHEKGLNSPRRNQSRENLGNVGTTWGRLGKLADRRDVSRSPDGATRWECLGCAGYSLGTETWETWGNLGTDGTFPACRAARQGGSI